MAASADNVPVGVIQQAFDDSVISVGELARRMDWVRVSPDVRRAKRALGRTQSGGNRPPQKSVTYKRAVELIDAMGLEPVDYGL